MKATRAQFARRKRFLRRVGMRRVVRDWDGYAQWILVDRWATPPMVYTWPDEKRDLSRE